ncbi:MAG: PKD domain-containing protein [Bacteroidota bacterium]
MTKTPGTPDQFDAFLERIEHRSKRQRRKKLLMLVPILLFSGIVLATLWPSDAAPEPAQLGAYQIEELDEKKVAQLFKVDNVEFVLEQGPFGRDTVRSLQQYQRLQKLHQQVADDRQEILQSDRQADTIRVAALGRLPAYRVAVDGERVVGSWLTFTIQNFDPGVSYTLDLGNGILRENIEQSIRYRYPLPGHFVMQLIANRSGVGTSVYTKKYEIKAQETVAVEDSP